jgi:succinoglycan biosynthesis transport protein ExoP
MAVESHDGEDMKMDMSAMLRSVWSRKVRIVLVTALLLVLTYAILLFVPKMYESSASLLVESRENSYTRANNDAGSSSTAGVEATISSQIELIKSRDTLLSVIRSEKLDEVPELNEGGASSIGLVGTLLGRKAQAADVEEAVLQNLNDRLTVIRERDSSIISIYVRSIDPALAARIANALANTYVGRRAALSLSDTAEASVWLDEQIKQLRVRVADAENQVASFRIDNDLLTGANSTSLLDQQLSNIATQITSAQERKNTAQSRAALIRGMLEKGQPLEGVSDVRDSTVIQQLSETKAALQGERAQKLATLLPNHPGIRAIVAQIAELDKQIAIEGRRVADALDAEAQIEAALETSLQADLNRIKSGVSTATKETVNLNELEREAKAQRDLLESYLLRYRDAVSRTDSSSALPDIRVVTMAAPAVSPVSPKSTLILAAVALVVLTLQIGSILFGELLSVRALMPRYQPAMPAPGAALAEPEMDRAVAEPAAAPPAPQAGWDDGGEIKTSAQEHPFTSEAEPDYVGDVEPDYLDDTMARSALPAELYEIPPHYEAPARQLGQTELDALSADIALGQVRVIMVCSVESEHDSASISDTLIAEALHAGLSVVSVDAGSARTSVEPGLSDLSAEFASFGDVVHKTPLEGLAEVPWGQQRTLDRRSMKPFTLVEALTDIYEFVVVQTGRIGMTSALPLFAGIECHLILAAGENADENLFRAARADAQALGFGQIRVIASPLAKAEVA